MTILAAAFRDPTDYAIASDSLGVDSSGARFPARKLWSYGPVLVGGTGSPALLQAAAAAVTATEAPNVADQLRRAVVPLVGVSQSESPARADAAWLIVSPTGILWVDAEGAVYEMEKTAAIGAGGPVARGAMHALIGQLDCYAPRLLVEHAVRAAIALDSGCGGVPVVLRGPR